MAAILLKNALLLDRDHGNVPGDILIQDQTIQAVEQGIAPEAAQQVYDLRGCTVLPGMFNNHLHVVAPDGSPDKTFVAQHLQEFAQNGVTAIRDMGIDQKYKTYQDYVAWKAAMDTPDHPELFTYGYFQRLFELHFGPPPGEDTEDLPPMPKMPPQPYHHTPEEAAAAVEEAHSFGCCGIKIHGFRRGEEEYAKLKAMVAVAKKYGMKVAAHINETDECVGLMDCGAQEAAHIATDLTDPAVIDRMAAYGFVVTPTVANYFRMNRDGMFRHGEYDNILKNIENYHRAGIKMTVGTDFMGTKDAPYVDTDIPVKEMELMASCGMSVQSVVAAATINAAETCNAQDRMGTLTPGKLANLIAVPGTVDSTFQALHQVKLVLNRGTVIKDQLPRKK